MSQKKASKAPLLLSPLLISMLAVGAANAREAQPVTGSVDAQQTASTTTGITHEEISSEIALKAQKLIDAAEADELAVQCSFYSVDSGGQGHCAFYDTASTGPGGNGVSMGKFTV